MKGTMNMTNTVTTGFKRILDEMPPREDALFRMLISRQPIAVRKMYSKIYIGKPESDRKAQQLMGSIISRINVRIGNSGYRVIPCEDKRGHYILKRLPRRA
jgi:hypothetical protein